MSDTQHNNTMPCADSRYAECRVLFTVMLNVVMLSVVMLSVVVPNYYTRVNVKTNEIRVKMFRRYYFTV
jgi:hypothetical protein